MNKRDQQFKEMMKSYEPVKAPVDFSKSVMSQIYDTDSVTIEDKPILNKWIIRMMIGGFALFVLYLLSNTSAESSQNSEFVRSFFQKIPQADFGGFIQVRQQIIGFISEIPSVVILTLLASTLLLLLDLFVLRRFRHSLAS